MKSEREINEIRGKLMGNVAAPKEIERFLDYVKKLEELIEEASVEDFYGTEGWRHRIWD